MKKGGNPGNHAREHENPTTRYYKIVLLLYITFGQLVDVDNMGVL